EELAGDGETSAEVPLPADSRLQRIGQRQSGIAQLLVPLLRRRRLGIDAGVGARGPLAFLPAKRGARIDGEMRGRRVAVDAHTGNEREAFAERDIGLG